MDSIQDSSSKKLLKSITGYFFIVTMLFLIKMICILGMTHRIKINQHNETQKLPLPYIKNLRKWINKDKKAS